MKFLSPGDTIDIIAPAFGSVDNDLTKIENFLQSWQLTPRIPDDLFGEDLFCSNSDSKRFEHLQAALTNTTSKAVWCLRGGYGSMKLIPYLLKMQKPAIPKIFIGSSDITALHIFLQQHWHWPSIHGPSLHTASIEKVSASSLNLLKKTLFNTEKSLLLEDLTALNAAAKQDMSLNSAIIGGNLSLVQTSLGTPWQIKPDAKILLLEDVNESAYRIDRMLEQLIQADISQKATAIVVADFTVSKAAHGAKIQKTLERFANLMSVPVLQLKGVGHDFTNDPVILGARATLKLGNKPFLTMQF